jgi:integrase
VPGWYGACAYALAQGAVVHNPAARRPRLSNAAQLTPSGLDPWQTAVLLAAVDRHTSQDRACCYLRLGLGLRSGQIVGLTLDDLLTDQDIGRGPDTLRLPEPDGGHRLVPLPPLVRDAVSAYLPHRRPPQDTTCGGPLFTAPSGIRVPRHYPAGLLRAVAEETGLLRSAVRPLSAYSVGVGAAAQRERQGTAEPRQHTSLTDSYNHSHIRLVRLYMHYTCTFRWGGAPSRGSFTPSTLVTPWDGPGHPAL